MDKIELKKEILDEINGLYQSNKIDKLVEVFISIMQIKGETLPLYPGRISPFPLLYFDPLPPCLSIT